MNELFRVIYQVNNDEVKQVRQFHFMSWPDFGVPRHATPLLHFLRRVRNAHSYDNPKPLLIHCRWVEEQYQCFRLTRLANLASMQYYTS